MKKAKRRMQNDPDKKHKNIKEIKVSFSNKYKRVYFILRPDQNDQSYILKPGDMLCRLYRKNLNSKQIKDAANLLANESNPSYNNLTLIKWAHKSDYIQDSALSDIKNFSDPADALKNMLDFNFTALNMDKMDPLDWVFILWTRKEQVKEYIDISGYCAGYLTIDLQKKIGLIDHEAGEKFLKMDDSVILTDNIDKLKSDESLSKRCNAGTAVSDIIEDSDLQNDYFENNNSNDNPKEDENSELIESGYSCCGLCRKNNNNYVDPHKQGCFRKTPIYGCLYHIRMIVILFVNNVYDCTCTGLRCCRFCLCCCDCGCCC